MVDALHGLALILTMLALVPAGFVALSVAVAAD